jgi:hypothetical protein
MSVLALSQSAYTSSHFAHGGRPDVNGLTGAGMTAVAPI